MIILYVSPKGGSGVIRYSLHRSRYHLSTHLLCSARSPPLPLRKYNSGSFSHELSIRPFARSNECGRKIPQACKAPTRASARGRAGEAPTRHPRRTQLRNAQPRPSAFLRQGPSAATCGSSLTIKPLSITGRREGWEQGGRKRKYNHS